VLFALLLERGVAPDVKGLSLGIGDEHIIRQQPAEILQEIASVVTNMIEVAAPTLRGGSAVPVRYTSSAEVTVPSWLIDHQGHSLLAIVQSAFGGPSAVTPPALIKAFRRVRLIPVELYSMFAAIREA
jgi:hypothetical protein